MEVFNSAGVVAYGYALATSVDVAVAAQAGTGGAGCYIVDRADIGGYAAGGGVRVLYHLAHSLAFVVVGKGGYHRGGVSADGDYFDWPIVIIVLYPSSIAEYCITVIVP